MTPQSKTALVERVRRHAAAIHGWPLQQDLLALCELAEYHQKSLIPLVPDILAGFEAAYLRAKTERDARKHDESVRHYMDGRMDALHYAIAQTKLTIRVIEENPTHWQPLPLGPKLSTNKTT